jgi:hypothetical protein
MRTPVYTKPCCGLPAKPYPVIQYKLLPPGKNYAVDPSKRSKSDPEKSTMTTQQVSATQVGGQSTDMVINKEVAINTNVGGNIVSPSEMRKAILNEITNVDKIFSRSEMIELILNGYTDMRVFVMDSYKEITLNNHQQSLSSVEDWKRANNVNMELSGEELFKLRQNQHLKDALKTGKRYNDTMRVIRE